MIRSIVIAILGVFVWAQASAIDPITAESLMRQGNEAYTNEQYDEALEFYLEVAKEFSSAPLYFNIGNAYYRKSDIPNAILYFERAKQISPNDPDIVFNLSKANDQIVDKLEENPNQKVNEWFSNLLFGRGDSFWSWTSILLMCIAVAAFVGYLVFTVESRRRIMFYVGSTFVVLTIASLVLGGIQEKRQSSSGSAIIMTAKVDVKTSPSENSGNAFILHEGSKVVVQKENEEWLEISISGGNVGWVRKADLEMI